MAPALGAVSARERHFPPSATAHVARRAQPLIPLLCAPPPFTEEGGFLCLPSFPFEQIQLLAKSVSQSTLGSRRLVSKKLCARKRSEKERVTTTADQRCAAGGDAARGGAGLPPNVKGAGG